MKYSVTWALVSAGVWMKTAMNAGVRQSGDYLTAQVCKIIDIFYDDVFVID